MQRTKTPRRMAIAVALSLVPGVVLASAVEAQEGERMRLLVPALANKAGGKNDFGKKIAEEVQKRLNGMLTHQPVPRKELQDGLKKYGLKEEDLTDCTKTMQFAGLVGIPLIMCGTFEEAGAGATVNASIISPVTQDQFEIPAFQASDPKQAADQILSQFERYISQLSLASYCAQYIESQQWENALENCDKALAINPTGKGQLYNRSYALWKMDRDEDAMTALRKLLEVDALNQDAIYLAAILSTEMGDKQSASRYFHEYLEMNPGNKDVRLKIATDAANAGDPEGALAILEEGMKDGTADATMKMYAGHMAMNAANAKLANAGANGNEAEARALLQKALTYYEPVYAEQGNQIDGTVLINMLQAYRKLEQTDKAVTFGQAIAANSQDPKLLSAYADVLNDAGKRAEALAMLDRVVRADPSYAVNARKGLWSLQAGDLAAAKTALTTAVEKGEIEDSQLDVVAQNIAATGYRERGAKGQYQAAAEYYATAKQFAKSDRTRGMIAYFEGVDLYKQAEAQAVKQDLATARATLPRFQRVIDLMNQAAAFTQGSQQNEASRQSILKATRDHIEIAELIIRRG